MKSGDNRVTIELPKGLKLVAEQNADHQPLWIQPYGRVCRLGLGGRQMAACWQVHQIPQKL